MKIAQNDGVMNDIGPIRLSDILDGTSSTTLVAEKATDLYRRFERAEVEINRYGWYASGNFGDSLITAFDPPNGHIAAGRIALRYAASSNHARGVNVLTADGSARFVSDSMDSWSIDPATSRPIGIEKADGGWWIHVPRAGVWQAMATRASGEVIPGDSSQDGTHSINRLHLRLRA